MDSWPLTLIRWRSKCATSNRATSETSSGIPSHQSGYMVRRWFDEIMRFLRNVTWKTIIFLPCFLRPDLLLLMQWCNGAMLDICNFHMLQRPGRKRIVILSLSPALISPAMGQQSRTAGRDKPQRFQLYWKATWTRVLANGINLYDHLKRKGPSSNQHFYGNVLVCGGVYKLDHVGSSPPPRIPVTTSITLHFCWVEW